MNKDILSESEIKALRVIRNWTIHKGRTPSVRELMSELGFRSPRSGSLMLKRLIAKGYMKSRPGAKPYLLRDTEDHTLYARTVDVPLVGTVACGLPLLAEQNIEAMIQVSTQIARGLYKHFLLRTKGDSMNSKGINDGDLVLVRQQPTAKNGDSVVALIDDEATVKEIMYSENTVILKPCSTNKKHRPIVLTADFQIQGVVITSIPKEAING